MRSTILDALRAAGTELTVVQLAAATRIPTTTVRFHLQALVGDGLVVADTAPHTGRGRPRLVYRARAAMDPSGPRNYALLAQVLIQALVGVPDAQDRAAAAGRAWGAQRAHRADDPVDDLIAVLDEFGFAPEPVCDGIRLNRCPFLELAKKQPGLTCAVHRGIMDGVLNSHPTDLTLAGLDAFVDGDHCLTRLTGTGRA